MEFSDLINARRSIRSFKDAVPHEDLVRILTAARQAPSWKNSQTARCYVLEGAQTLEALRESILPPFNRTSSAHAALIVTCFVRDTAGFSDGKPANEAGNAWGAYDLGLHDSYLILAARDAGYDTLIMGIRDADVLRKKLSIPENEQIMSVIAVGKRNAEPTPRPRKPLEETVRFF